MEPPIAVKCRTAQVFIPTTTPPLFDNFLLVAEIHVGSQYSVDSMDAIYICNKIDAVIPLAPFHDSRHKLPSSTSTDGPWLVQTGLELHGDNEVLADIMLVGAAHNTPCLAILGVNFVRVQVRSLERALEAMNSTKEGPAVTSHKQHNAFYIDDISLGDFSKTYGDYNLDENSPCSATGTVSYSALTDITSKSIPKGPSTPPYSPTTAILSSTGPNNESVIATITTLLRDYLDSSQEISAGTTLGALGLDFLVLIQLQSDMEEHFGPRPRLASLNEDCTFSELCGMVTSSDVTATVASSSNLPNSMAGAPDEVEKPPSQKAARAAYDQSAPPLSSKTLATSTAAAFDALRKETGAITLHTGFAGFFANVYSSQTALVIAYIHEAFEQLGLDRRQLQLGARLPANSYLSKYERLVSRCYEILGTASAQSFPAGGSAAEMYRQILDRHPEYMREHKLLHLSGSRLADCIAGREDPLKLIFQNSDSKTLLQNVYVRSPMFSTGNQLIKEFFRRLLLDNHHNPVLSPALLPPASRRKIRILEIGAGTGATTMQLLDQLWSSEVELSYTFTDVSAGKVATSRRKLEDRYGGTEALRSRGVALEFTILDVEQPPPEHMLGAYDFVLSSNCFHAARDLGAACGNAAKLLRSDGGVLCLVKLARPLAWLDCVFGLLDGWWRFDDGRSYLLADELRCEETLLRAGFRDV